MSLGDLPAYPANYATDSYGEVMRSSDEPGYGQMGMSIRQAYATAAMQGILSDAHVSDHFAIRGRSIASKNGTEPLSETGSLIAYTAFTIADAMVKFEEDEINARRKTAEDEAKQEQAGEELGNKEI